MSYYLNWSISRWSIVLSAILFLLAVNFNFVSGTKKMPPHQLFVEDHYEIKSCLSPDLQEHERSTCRFYALMIDAGSTGTRIHIFEFSHDTKNPASSFKLENEIYLEVKPGLSDYASRPQEVTRTILPLIAKAKSVVPKNLWLHTPLALKATAGLRLLPTVDAEAILDTVEEVFGESPFLTNDEAVSVMSGTDEGIFGWFTVNFLLDRLDSLLLRPKALTATISQKLTTAALDLGGASTQVTFRPLSDETLATAPIGFLKEIKVFNETVPVYTHSYLGNGLMQSRLSILKLNNNAHSTQRNRLFTACMPQEYSVPWNYSNKVYTVHGSSKYGYERCRSEVHKFIVESEIDHPAELASRDIYAFGYYLDRISQAGLVDESSEGGYVKISQVEEAAKNACARTEFGPRHWHPWQCMDLTYIYSLLANGYNLPQDKSIFFVKKIRGMEVSWALGAAYHLLNTYHESGTLDHSGGFPDYNGHRAFGRYSDALVSAGHYMCSRMYYGLSALMSYFQLLA